MHKGCFRFSTLLIVISAFIVPCLNAQEETPVSPPTMVPPPPPNFIPDSRPPAGPPPPRPGNASAPAQASTPPAELMTIEQLLELPVDRLLELRNTIEKLANLSDQDKELLRRRLIELRNLERQERNRQREEFARKQETQRQARILVAQALSEEDKLRFEEELRANDRKEHLSIRQKYADTLLENDEAFRQRVEDAAAQAIERREAEAAAKRQQEAEKRAAEAAKKVTQADRE